MQRFFDSSLMPPSPRVDCKVWFASHLLAPQGGEQVGMGQQKIPLKGRLIALD